MENYKCKKCGSFLACFDDDMVTFKAKRGVKIENDKIILKCKCGYETEVLRTLDEILENPNVGSLIIPSTYKVSGQTREYKEYLKTTID